jgi:tungstate transport system substrate-binding protein
MAKCGPLSRGRALPGCLLFASSSVRAPPAAKASSSWFSPPPRRRTQGCSIISCPSSPPRPASRSGWWRWAPGQAIKNAERGDGDVLLVHARAAEEQFVAEGFGVERHDVMYNDYVIVGPQSDPADIAGLTDPVAAFTAHRRGGRTLRVARRRFGHPQGRDGAVGGGGVDAPRRRAPGTAKLGSGMGADPQYCRRHERLYAHRPGDLGGVREQGQSGHPRRRRRAAAEPLRRHPGEPGTHPHIKAELGQRFIDWLVGPEGQAAIASFRVDGEQLFFPAHGPL